MSFEFDESYYLKSKLQQLIKLDADTYGGWGTDNVKDAIQNAGMTVLQHFEQYSLAEGTSPNPYFNTMEYLEAKVNQLNSMEEGGRSNWTVAQVIEAFKNAGFTNAMDHYEQYGCKEVDNDGKLINPSNAFDANAYVAAKLAQLQATDPENWGSDKTAQDVLEAITDAGMTPIDHFEQYGEAEGDAAGIDMVQTVPVVERVANDELRDAMGENVPSNYNPATAAPKNVTEGTSVAKPCDMGDSSTVKPEEPVATPADGDAYMPVPGGGIKDTNENPVVLVSETVKNAAGEDVTLAQYGVTQNATTDADGNTVQEIAAVDDKGQVATDADPIVKTTTDPTGNQTVETKMEDADGNKIEKTSNADKDGNVTAENTKADFADGSSTEVAKAVTTDPSTGYTTTTETRSDTTAAGATTTTEHSESVSPSGNETITTDKTTNPDGTSTEETKTVTKNDDGSTTTKDSVKETAADGTSTEKTTTETQNADGEQVGDKTEVTTERDADGAISKQETKTTDTSGESKTEDTTEEAQKDDPDTPTPDDGGGSSEGTVAGRNIAVDGSDETTLTGTAGADTFTFAATAGSNTVNGKAGDDVFIVSKDQTAGDTYAYIASATLDGAAGNDTLRVAAGDEVVDLTSGLKTNNIEVLEVAAGASVKVTAAKNFSLDGSDTSKFTSVKAADATAKIEITDAIDASLLAGQKATVKAEDGGFTVTSDADLSGLVFVSDVDAGTTSKAGTVAVDMTDDNAAHTITVTGQQAEQIKLTNSTADDVVVITDMPEDGGVLTDENNTAATYQYTGEGDARLTVKAVDKAVVTLQGAAGNDTLTLYGDYPPAQNAGTLSGEGVLIGGQGADFVRGGGTLYAGAQDGSDSINGANANFLSLMNVDKPWFNANPANILEAFGADSEAYASTAKDVFLFETNTGDADDTASALKIHDFTLNDDVLYFLTHSAQQKPSGSTLAGPAVDPHNPDSIEDEVGWTSEFVKAAFDGGALEFAANKLTVTWQNFTSANNCQFGTSDDKATKPTTITFEGTDTDVQKAIAQVLATDGDVTDDAALFIALIGGTAFELTAEEDANAGA